MKPRVKAMTKRKENAIYDRIREILESARAGVARTVNTTQVMANWLIGREIVEEEQRGKKRAGYGAQLIADLSARLLADYGRGYAARNLASFREFYLQYPRLLEISHAVRANLVVPPPEISPREILHAPRAKSGSPKSDALRRKSSAGDTSKEVSTLPQIVSRQERITLEGDHFYIDLVFYHTVLKCYVLIDLKVGKLTHGDLGQAQLYVNYFDRERRTAGDQPTLGLILCMDKNEAVVKYTLSPEQEKKIFASRYKLHLPTEAELKAELTREVKELTRS